MDAEAELRPYQRDAVEAAVNRLEKEDRTTLVMACGSGKTWVALETARRMLEKPDSLLVIAVPSLSLMQQWYGHLVQRLENARVLGVCSDEELRTESSGEITAPTTTSQERISEFLEEGGFRVVLCTYHSSPLLGRTLRSGELRADLLIADEAHRTAGAQDAVFTTVLFNNRLSAAKRLFLTATPRMRLVTQASDGTRMISMADTALYGERAYTYTFGQAIQEDYLSDYRVVVMVVSDQTVHRRILRNEGTMIGDQAFNVRSLASCLALTKLRSDFGIRSSLVFHNTISASRAFTANLKALSHSLTSDDPPEVHHLDGVTPQTAREAALRSLGSPGDGWSVASNVRVLTEGVDVPSIDAVMFAEPRKSQIDVVQAIGRALRLSPHGRRSVILIPVYLAPGESPDAMLSGSEYRHIWQVINAIRDHDRSLDQEIESIRRNEYDPTRPRYEPHVMPEKILVTGFGEDLDRYASAISTLILDNITTNRASGLDEFIAWMGRERNPDVPVRYVNPETHFPLGRWVQSQRQAYRWGRLSEEDIRRYEEAGFSWGARSKRWRRMMARIDAYRGVLSAERLMATQVALYDAELFSWIREQDERMRDGRASPGEVRELVEVLMGTRETTERGPVEESADRLLAHLHKKLRSGAKRKRVLRVTAIPQKLVPDAQTVCNNHFLLDEEVRRELMEAGLELSSRVQVVPGEEGWEERVIAAVNDELPWDGVRFMATDHSARKGGEAHLDRRTGRQALSTHRRTYAIDRLPLMTRHELFPQRNWICISEKMLPHHIPKVGRVREYASITVANAESSWHRENGVARDGVLVVAEDFTVWRAPDIDSPEEEWTTSGKLTHHLDEIAYQVNSSGSLDESLLLQHVPELGELDPADRILLLERVMENYLSLMAEVIQLTTKDLFPRVRVRQLDHSVDLEAHLVAGARNRRRVATICEKMDQEMALALRSAYSQHIVAITRNLLSKVEKPGG